MSTGRAHVGISPSHNGAYFPQRSLSDETFSIDNCQTDSTVLQKASGLSQEVVSQSLAILLNFYAIYLYIVYTICSIFLAQN